MLCSVEDIKFVVNIICCCLLRFNKYLHISTVHYCCKSPISCVTFDSKHAEFHTTTYSYIRRWAIRHLFKSWVSSSHVWHFSATIGAFCHGNVVVWPSNALQDNQIPVDIDISHSKEWIVSIFMIGAAIVPWFASKLWRQHMIQDIKIYFQLQHSNLLVRSGHWSQCPSLLWWAGFCWY